MTGQVGVSGYDRGCVEALATYYIQLPNHRICTNTSMHNALLFSLEPALNYYALSSQFD